MRTAWHQRHLDEALELTGERRYRSALDRLTTVLSVYPDDEDTLEVAAMVVSDGSRASSEPEGTDEALGPRQWFDTRLNGIFCQCEVRGCTKAWPTNHFEVSRYAGALITNPIGGLCHHCGRTFCRNHAKSTRRHEFACPNCRRPLDPSPPPNRTDSPQTERFNKPIVHAGVVLEHGGIASREELQALFEIIAPDVFEAETGPSISPTSLPTFDGVERDLINIALGSQARDYLTADRYDFEVFAGVSTVTGGRWLLVKLFEDRPKVVDPDR